MRKVTELEAMQQSLCARFEQGDVVLSAEEWKTVRELYGAVLLAGEFYDTWEKEGHRQIIVATARRVKAMAEKGEENG